MRLYTTISMCILLTTALLFAETAALDIRTFISGSSLYIVKQDGIIAYRNDTRSVRSVILCDTVVQDSIYDAAVNSGVLYVLATSGLYEIDLATSSISVIPGGKKGSSGCRIAVDDDYLWAGIGTDLCRFDKLGRDWFIFTTGLDRPGFLGLQSENGAVYCVQNSGVKIFSTQDEKWRDYMLPGNTGMSASSRFFTDKNGLIVVDSARIVRYLYASQAWDIMTTNGPLVDFASFDSTWYYQTSGGTYVYQAATGQTTPLNLGDKGRSTSLARSGDTLYCATTNGWIKYDLINTTSDNIAMPSGGAGVLQAATKTILFNDTLIGLYPRAVSVYSGASGQWQTVVLAGSAAAKTVTWDDDNGLKGRYGRGWYSQLRGNVQQYFSIDSVTASDFVYTLPDPLVNLTLHNQLADSRYLDLYFNNTVIGQVAQKGLLYRGANSDYVDQVKLGTTTIDIPQAQTVPRAQFEGGMVALQSRSMLATRDRRTLKAQAGAGLLTTRTHHEILPYAETGLYRLQLYSADTVKKGIVPGSLSVTVDGEEIDPADVMFVALSGTLSFNRQDILDPSSVISVSYQVRPLPDSGLGVVEVVPQNNFGTVAYGSVTAAPVDWISPQVGFVHLDLGADSSHELIALSAPVEIRTGKAAFLLKAVPEFSYDALSGAKALSLALQSRIGDKLSLTFNGLLPDSHFVTTDDISRGNGFLQHTASYSIAYDIQKELPVSFSHSDISSQRGIERRYELTAREHYTGFPAAELMLSRAVVNAHRRNTLALMRMVRDTVDTTIGGRDTVAIKVVSMTPYDSIAGDTLDRLKDKIRLRLFETSSPLLERFLHSNDHSPDY